MVWFSSLTAVGKKLFHSRVVLEQMLLFLLPDCRRGCEKDGMGHGDAASSADAALFIDVKQRWQ